MEQNPTTMNQNEEGAYQWAFVEPVRGGHHETIVPLEPPKKQSKQMRIIKSYTDAVRQFLWQNFDGRLSIEEMDRFTKLALLYGPDRAMRAMLRRDSLWTKGDTSDMVNLHFWTEGENMDTAIQYLRFDYLERVQGVVRILDLSGLYEPPRKAGEKKPAQPTQPSTPDTLDQSDTDTEEGEGEIEEVDQKIPEEFAKYFTGQGKTVKQFFKGLRKLLNVQPTDGGDDVPAQAQGGTMKRTNPTLHPSLQGLVDVADQPPVPAVNQPKGILKPTNLPIGNTQEIIGSQVPTQILPQTPEKMVYEIRFIAPGEWEYTGRVVPISKQKPEPVFPTATQQTTKTPNKTEYTPMKPILGHLGKIAGTKETKSVETTEPAIYKAIDAVARTMENSNIPPDNPYSALTMAMTAAVIEGIKTAKEEKKKSKEDAKKETIKIEVLKPSLDDLSIDSFDYNINGMDPESILGSRFKNTVFKNEEARIAVMRGILQRVIDDPKTSWKTRDESLRIMGQCDIPRMYDQMYKRASINVLEAMSKPVSMPETKYPRGQDSDSSDEDEDEDKDLIPPPVLGTNDNFGPHLVKSLRASLGITEQDKYDVEKDGKSLKYYLPMLKSQITANRLNRECAFSLFLSVLGGDSEQDVRNRLSSGESFEHVWMHMQKMASERLSQEGAFREIQRLCKEKPTNPEAVFTKIRNLRLRMYAHIKKPAIRKAQFERTVQEDMIRMMTLHYGMLYPLVMAQFKAKKDAHRMMRKLKKQQGIPKEQIEEFNDVDVLMETICTNIKKTAGSMDGTGPKQVYVDEISVTAQPPSGSGSTPSMADSGRSSQKSRRQRNQNQQQQQQQQQMIQQPMQQPMQPMQMAMAPQQQTMMFQPQQTSMQMQQQPQQPTVMAPAGQKSLFDPYPERSAADKERMAKYINALGENRCILCGRSGHFARTCKAYPGGKSGDIQCQMCEGFHETECMKSKLQARYNELVATGQIAPRAARQGGNRNGMRRGGNPNYPNNIQQQQMYYQQQQPMQQMAQQPMQMQPVQYVAANGQQLMAMPQQQQQQQQQPNGQAVGYFHVPQPQNMQMVTIPNQAVNNMKPGAVLGNNGIQAVPETAYMNPMVVTQAQIAQPTMAYTTEAPVNK